MAWFTMWKSPPAIPTTVPVPMPSTMYPTCETAW